MPDLISVAVQGPDAGAALAELLAIPGLVASREPPKPPEPRVVTRDGGALVAIGAIVGVVGGVTGIATNVIAWRDAWRKAHGKRLSVVIEDAKGNRLALDSATPEQVTAVLETLRGD
ncbi:MAG: hypothetical protein JWM27_406 [Gemmatimonadetes bacterium]|nr:hypothetical protein [Gemmatimonadota bacterium]